VISYELCFDFLLLAGATVLSPVHASVPSSFVVAEMPEKKQ